MNKRFLLSYAAVRGVHLSVSGPLIMWVIYDSPKDARMARFVARKFEIGPGTVTPTRDAFEGDTLEEMRSLLPPGLHRLAREPGDDPVIVETWL
jgi:hypothetical protein